METAEANTRASRAFVAALARAGVTDACVSPGSRSTPLTLALAEQHAIRPWLHLDERSAGFFALGLARATGRPVALVCTSGTAAANYLPAVAEANLGRVPLIVCTTDRPPHLRDVGAAQTIDQVRLYGTHVKWSQDLPLPTSDRAVERFEAFAARAVAEAVDGIAGPVHLNLPFDEPLLLPPDRHPAPLPPAARGAIPRRTPASPVGVGDALAVLRRSERPIIVAGPETGGLPAAAVAQLAERLDAPILADPLSGLRTGGHNRDRVVDSYDAFLRDPKASRLAPDVILRFGAVPTSKPLNQFIARQAGASHILCDLPGGWRDPDALTTRFIGGDPALVCDELTGGLPARAAGDWTREWVATGRRAATAMREAAEAIDEPFEGRVFTELQDALPAGSTIVAGNSMPVRDMDSFVASGSKSLRLVANRGANGIDGVVSSAVGAAAAGDGRVVLVIGDLSFYHDMNGLWAAKRHGLDLTIVLVNNEGGGIFHYLPQAAHPAVFEEWWGTPSGLDFRHAANLYGATYACSADWPAFRRALTEGAGSGLHIIEVPTDRARNAAMHREAWDAACRAAWQPEGAAVP
ncbi:MAG: 2-succinyl-5-enolpyruvyl-6-hydroxy-3-cyclohexene-1-carboxylic-acid synthase [Chloroflexi bacterium]|nr:2-succinyl-5-enolpyruvyl-6-hydroxy-3-cyclohexene-1-carboxylic-acid synthase [Chloroflexota bacterium]